MLNGSFKTTGYRMEILCGFQMSRRHRVIKGALKSLSNNYVVYMARRRANTTEAKATNLPSKNWACKDLGWAPGKVSTKQ